MISYYEHNKHERIPILINHLEKGHDLAVISNAGTPGISDPAYKLIREAIKKEIKVESIPGVSAAIAALISSGLPTDRFLFEGFLPPKKGRKNQISKNKEVNATLIYFENPKRLKRTLKDLLDVLGDRPAVIARELTKIHEEIKRGTIKNILTALDDKTIRGECVILIGKNNQNVYF